jgi:hypothetical protein
MPNSLTGELTALEQMVLDRKREKEEKAAAERSRIENSPAYNNGPGMLWQRAPTSSSSENRGGRRRTKLRKSKQKKFKKRSTYRRRR